MARTFIEYNRHVRTMAEVCIKNRIEFHFNAFTKNIEVIVSEEEREALRCWDFLIKSEFETTSVQFGL